MIFFVILQLNRYENEWKIGLWKVQDDTCNKNARVGRPLILYTPG